MEELDLTHNEFEKNEDDEYVRQVLEKLQRQLVNLRTINRMP